MKPKYLSLSLYHPHVMRGGAQKVAYDLFKEVERQGDWEAYFLGAIHAPTFPQYTRTGAPITSFERRDNEFLLLTRKFDDFRQMMLDERLVGNLTNFVEEIKPDIVHIHHTVLIGIDTIMLLRKLLPDATFLFSLHEYIPICINGGHLLKRSNNLICSDFTPSQCVQCFPEIEEDKFHLRRELFQLMLDEMDVLIAVSDDLRERYVKWGIDPEKITVIGNGHPILRSGERSKRASDEVNVFGFFGQYVDCKGIDILLAAAVKAALAEEDKNFVVRLFGGNKTYATADFLERIESILADKPENLEIDERGPYPSESVVTLMETVDWVVVPSIWPESFVLTVSEAWDAGRPVIASEAGALKDRILDEVNGIHFHVNDVNDLAEKMLKCCGNRELWQSLNASIRDEIGVDEAYEAHKLLAEKHGNEQKEEVPFSIPAG